ncbi:MAG TPA: MerR family transcriptional regulator [Thermomicrobiales bacterium]|nr:MerR family transcriptional regulator [Thermomicrobiales bacterium]
MASDAGYRVGQMAEFGGVTVRTLHHYEQIGLLVPSARSDAGYRLYVDSDIDRLSRILYYRELGFSLIDIATMLDDPAVPARDHLARQHRLLIDRLGRVQAMVAAIEREMEAAMSGYNLTAGEKLEVFGDFDPDQYEDEAQKRWGDTDAWAESKRRTSQYDKVQWQAIQAEAAAISDRFVALMSTGVLPASPEAMAVAEDHRLHLGRWFYDCSPEMHRALGEMYIADERFTANIDRAAPGLAIYMCQAIAANADFAGQSF